MFLRTLVLRKLEAANGCGFCITRTARRQLDSLGNSQVAGSSLSSSSCASRRYRSDARAREPQRLLEFHQ